PALAEIRDALVRLDAKPDQRVGNAIGVDVEFGESCLASLEFISQRAPKRFGALAHHVGKVRQLRRSGHVSPVASWYRCAEFGVIRQQRQYGASFLRTQEPIRRGLSVRTIRSVALAKRAMVVMGSCFRRNDNLAPCRAVLLVLCLDRIARLVPVV